MFRGGARYRSQKRRRFPRRAPMPINDQYNFFFTNVNNGLYEPLGFEGSQNYSNLEALQVIQFVNDNYVISSVQRCCFSAIPLACCLAGFILRINIFIYAIILWCLAYIILENRLKSKISKC